MQISEKDFLNYIKCPLYYKLEMYGEDLEKDSYNKFLHYTANQYINRIANTPLLGNFNHEKYVKKIWDKVCMNKQPGIELLDTSITYVVSPDGSKYSVTGTLDPIIKQGDFYTTFIISFSDKLPESYTMDLNLKHTLDAYAINELIPNAQHVITYHSFRSNTEKDTVRFSDQFKRLDNIIETIGQCIEQDLIYPRNSYSCSSCKMRGLCDKWIGEKIHKNGDGRFDGKI